MSVSGVAGAPGVLNTYGADALQSASSIGSLSSTGASGSTAGVAHDNDGGDSARISPLAQMLGKLQQLKDKDPAKFKQVLSDIADKLQALSQQQGDAGGSRLTKLAERFRTAAESGDLSGLQPSGHHHHRHGGAAGAYGQAGSQDQHVLQPAPGNGSEASYSSTVASQLSGIFSEIDTALAA